VFVMKLLCFALFACAFNLLLGFTGLLSSAMPPSSARPLCHRLVHQGRRAGRPSWACWPARWRPG
jgi:hypothetical protein